MECSSEVLLSRLSRALVRIDGGWFTMGSDDGADNERPVHRVWVDAFFLAPCQVTNADYALFLESSGHPPQPMWRDPAFDHPRQPVVAVSWLDAVRYCEWLGGGFRLPTEAEWERAARGGAEGVRYPWGDDVPDERGRWLTGPEPVGGGVPNAFGLYDMCENVHEWCSDWYAADYYAVSPQRNPRGPESGTRRVSRGGSWRHRIKVSRCAARSSLPPEFRYADYGFRIARDARLESDE
jgi:formylglycine-generating enzyme required for sulfatase activity